MKKIFIVMAVAVAACSTNKIPTTQIHPATKVANDQAIAYPYKAGYSASFEIGDPSHSKTVLGILKSWDDNTLSQAKTGFGDTVTLHFADGTRFTNINRDSAVSALNNMRVTYGTVTTFVDAWMPFHTTDKKDHWVAIWSRQHYTQKDGHTDSVDLHEIWAFDKNGKAIFLSRYDAVLPPH